ncbi:MAG: class I SAM-dependent methyltransferase [Xanthomonadales bacterium]|nr:class I SAM-dependent methyltransferase [Xanthomonadales bacterium]
MSEPLEFTGERYTPECLREIRYEHVHRYVFARGLVAGRRVLDAACGEGYGSALLAETASRLVGVDVSPQAVAHASERYRAPNLEFRQADCLALPFPDDEFDCVVSFETLEHLENHEQLMAEFKRVLRPGGFLLISTPDKAIYTDQQGNRNEFHVAELYRDEFDALLERHFAVHRLWGQKLLFQSAIWSLQPAPGVVLHQESGASVSTSPSPEHEAVYLLALCADDAACLPNVPHGLSLFDDAQQSVYEHYYHEIRKNMAAGGLLQEKEREISKLKAALAQALPRPSWWRRLLGKG